MNADTFVRLDTAMLLRHCAVHLQILVPGSEYPDVLTALIQRARSRADELEGVGRVEP
jgi:hypothetical protein